jgi:hypothetical protein|nr:translocation/assembly module TamB domain-containing protein [uncultured Porphyromonas sp.]
MRYWQVNKHFLKVLRVVAWIAATLFLLFYLLPLGLFRIPAVQREAAARVGKFLTELFDSPVSLHQVKLVGWTDVEVHGVTVLDTVGREMLRANRLVGSITLSDLITEGEVRITSARLFSAHLSLHRDSVTGRLNVQHVIDHLSKPKRDKASIPVDINSIIIRDLGLTLQQGDTMLLELQKLSTRIRRLRFSPNYIAGAVDELSFGLTNGFTLSSLTAQGELHHGRYLTLRNAQATLPNSQFALPLLRLDLGGKGLKLLHEVELADTYLALSDFAPFFPQLGEHKERLYLRGLYTARTMETGQGSLSVRLPGLLNLEEQLSLSWNQHGALSSVQLDTETLEVRQGLIELVKPYLPASLHSALDYGKQLGALSYHGHLDYKVAGAIKARGTLGTDLGKWQHDLEAHLVDKSLRKVRTDLSTESFLLTPLLGGKVPLERLGATIKLEAQRSTDRLEDWQVGATITSPQLTYQGYTYRDLSLAIRPLRPYRHELQLSVNDPNASLSVRGAASFDGKVVRDMDLSLSTDLHPEALGLSQLLGKYNIKATGSANFDVLNIDRGHGMLALQSLSLTTPKQTLSLHDLQLQLIGSPESGRLIHITSPYLTAQLSGHYTVGQILPDLKQTLRHYLPSLQGEEGIKHPLLAPARSSYELDVKIKTVPEEWAEYLRLPIRLEQGGSLRALYTGGNHELTLYAEAPDLRLGDHHLSGLHVTFADRRLQLSSDVRLAKGTEVKDVGIYSDLQTDSIYTRISLGRDQHGVANGFVGIGTRLERVPLAGTKAGVLRTTFDLSPSLVRINGEDWTIAPAQVHLQQGEVHVRGLDLSSAERRVSIDGALSNQPNEHLNVALKKINLLYILQSAGVGFDMLDTEITGRAKASLRNGAVVATADVSSPAFFVKGVDVGTLRAGLTFDSRDGRLMIRGHVAQPDGGMADVSGYIRPAGGAGLDLSFDATRLRATFVGRFMDTLFDRVDGKASGHVRLFGVFDEGVTVEGTADVEEGCLGVRLLGTSYYFDHRLTFTPISIQLDNIPMRDDEGHTGIAHGVIRHRFFDHFDLDLEARDMVQMKVLQTKSKQRLPFYGTAYGSGSAKLRGHLPRLLLDVNMRSAEGTDLTLDFNKTDIRKEDRLVVFKPLRPTAPQDSLHTPAPAPTNEGETELTMRMAFRVTPEARIALRLGSSNIPNEVKARCEGDLTIEVPHTGPVTTYGGLTLREGSYVFNFEQLTRRRFTLLEGGRLDFRGDPMQASIDLKAIYSLTANIADLDAGLSTESKRTHMPVNCTLHLSGEISKPDIHLGLELPGAEPEVDRRVQSLVNTEDERNRQVLYLMTIGKFYTPENRRNTRGVSDGWASLAASTLSEQLTHVLGNFSKDIQLGTNIRTSTTAFEDTDIELLFSGSWLGDRLIINGNVGYHDNPFLQGKYIGEFDLEYKLNPAGTLRLKGYNHYNNMYQYLRQSLTTQGLGFMFQRRFNSFTELFAPGRNKRKKRTFAEEKRTQP